MNNEPVAWMFKHNPVRYSFNTKEDMKKFNHKEQDGWVPLYTLKEITDESIKQIFAKETGFDFDDNPGDGMALMDFVRAVLREAQS